jgi:hypothetical protein
MHVFGRKKKWKRVVGKMTSNAAKSPALKTGAAAFTGIVTAVAASAAVSSARRKSQS